MWGYIGRRILATIPVLLIVALLVFMMLRFTPGDPAAVIAGDSATSADLAEIRAKLGLDRSMVTQFVIWFGNVLQGDFGESFFYKKTVASLIGDRLEPTLALAVLTIVLATLIAVPLGTLAAYRQGSWIDRSVMGLSVMGFSVPVFVVGYVLILVFSLQFGWFPVQGYQRLSEGFWGFLHRLLLPSFTLAIVYVALLARMTRTSVLEVLNEDYVRTARAKGARERRVIYRHALRNALLPITSGLGLSVLATLSGSVAIELVFNRPGIGEVLISAIAKRDYPVVQGGVVVFAFFVVLVNLLVDLAYAIVDPRIRTKP